MWDAPVLISIAFWTCNLRGRKGGKEILFFVALLPFPSEYRNIRVIVGVWSVIGLSLFCFFFWKLRYRLSILHSSLLHSFGLFPCLPSPVFSFTFLFVLFLSCPDCFGAFMWRLLSLLQGVFLPSSPNLDYPHLIVSSCLTVRDSQRLSLTEVFPFISFSSNDKLSCMAYDIMISYLVFETLRWRSFFMWQYELFPFPFSLKQ
jgi:hypothetical protein